MLLPLNSKQALELIDSPEIIREDQVIPGHFRPCMDSPYGAGYDWIYRYERKIAPFFEPLLKSHHAELAGEKGLLYEALSNAFCYGHHKNPLKPITVSVLLGRTGLIVRVSDCGKGFNVKKVYKHYEKRKRRFSSVGNGIRLMASSPCFGIFYNQKGTAINFLYLFENGLSILSPDRIVSAPEPQGELKKLKG